jgi:nucleoid DNA-binding protein
VRRIESVVSDSYAWFKGMVKARRQLDDEMLQRVADGRVFTGRQGIPLKLVDELGDERRRSPGWRRKRTSIPRRRSADYRLRDRLGDLPVSAHRDRDTLDAWGWVRARFEEWGAAGDQRSTDGPWRFAIELEQNGARMAISSKPSLVQMLKARLSGRAPRRNVSLAGRSTMIKSELVQRISAQNRIFIQRDVRTSSTPSSARSSRRWRAATRSKVRGFGAFSVKNRPARPGAIPALERTCR